MDQAEALSKPPMGEVSPLLLSTGASSSVVEEDADPQATRGHASVTQTVLNVSKACMGTGTLALPFAARQAGILLNVFGIVAIVAWNVFSVHRLCQCLELLPRSYKRKQGMSTLSQVAFYALGSKGMYIVDSMFVVLLIGVIVAYEDAVLSFLRDTPITTGSAELNALATATIIGLLSTGPDMGYLSKASAFGLMVLSLTFLVIACYGEFGGFSVKLYPNGMAGVSHWFGCVVFGFGTVPLTYNLRESMEEPRRILMAQVLGLAATAISYIVIGNGLLLLYPRVDGGILQELPVSGVLPTLVRIAMILVVLMTAPLLVIPCGELVEGRIFADRTVPPLARTVVRLGICCTCTCVSIFISGFVNVLSFVGCCCVSVVSFVIPPLLHLHLSIPSVKEEFSVHDHSNPLVWTTHWLDIVMLILGGTATVCSSVYTFRMLLD